MIPSRSEPLEPRPRPPRLRLARAPLPGGTGDALELPGELVLLVRVALPLASHRQRLAAVAFAVEDFVAEPIDAVHVALGPELAPGEYLVAVVRHEVMAAWTPKATGAERRLVPDMLALPVPPEGTWSAREAAGRVVARRPDGTGFATRLETFETFWETAGRPQIVLFGGHLSEAIPAGATGFPSAGANAPAAGFDLLQGRYASRPDGWRRLGARLALLGALTLGVHGAILAADVQMVGLIAAEREAALREALAARLGDLPPGLPLEVALRRALPPADAGKPRFLPLLARIGEALTPLAGRVGFRALGYGADESNVTVTLEAADLATLQRAERELAAAGLEVAAGVATTGNGAAEVRMAIGVGR